MVQAISYKVGELHVEPEEVGGYSGHTNKYVMNQACRQAVFSWL